MSSEYDKGDCLPDACGNYEHAQHLLERQRKDDNRNFLERLISRDRYLLFACLILITLMNIPSGHYVLYPFKIFSTWVHEMCHAIAAFLMGGRVTRLTILANGGGMTNTSVNGAAWKRGFVSSAGYPGTSVTGCIMLLYRRSTLGPTIGTIVLASCILLSCVLLVRNTFGILMLLAEGLFLLAAAWCLPAVWLDNLFNFLAATCCLNAVENVQDLFAENYADGSDTMTDAHSVAEKWGFDYRFWALLWLVTSFVATVVGIVFARDARELPFWSTKQTTIDSSTASVQSGTAAMSYNAHLV
jgi:Peptidase M50B-like